MRRPILLAVLISLAMWATEWLPEVHVERSAEAGRWEGSVRAGGVEARFRVEQDLTPIADCDN